jgi:UDP-N-acetylmuramoylalanine--D-glutamate ligase
MLQGQKILVMGMGRSGQSAAVLARDLGATVTTTDAKADAPPVDGCLAIHGEHRADDFSSADLVVISPGIPPQLPMIEIARQAGVPVLGELGFAAHLMADEALDVLAITGTNGKSSTTWFAEQILRGAGRNPFAGGNLGCPYSELAHLRLVKGDRSHDVAVVEVSSYQLETAGGFCPDAGAILNLQPDHLARHKTMDAYAAAKLQLFAHMGPEHTAILPPDSPRLATQATDLRERGVHVHWVGDFPGVRVEGDTLIFTGTADDGTLSLADFPLEGGHNQLNAAVACLLAISIDVPRHSLDLRCLKPLAHRLEPVHAARGIRWVNDSKATNVDAARTGIEGLGGTFSGGTSGAPIFSTAPKVDA